MWTLFERTAMPMQATSRGNEGKIHLGYVYAKDVKLATARLMVRGALCFDAFLRRHLGVTACVTPRSTPFVYGLHRESQMGARDIAAHFAAVDRLIADATASGVTGDYLGETCLPSSRPIPVERHFDPARVEAAFETPERAIDTRLLADAMMARVLTEPLITFHGGHDVERVERVGERFRLACAGGWITGFRHVVNASWDFADSPSIQHLVWRRRARGCIDTSSDCTSGSARRLSQFHRSRSFLAPSATS